MIKERKTHKTLKKFENIKDKIFSFKSDEKHLYPDEAKFIFPNIQ